MKMSAEDLRQSDREALLALAKAAKLNKRTRTSQDRIPSRSASSSRWPASFAQQRLWFVAQTSEPASVAYNIPAGLRLRGLLNDGALQAALDRIVRRHEALRTHFEEVDGQPMQCIADEGRLELIRHDLAGYADPAAEILHWREVELTQPFDLLNGPLVRGRLLRLGAQEHVLLLTMHHIVSDGWSLSVLVKELEALYRAYALEGVSAQIDPLPPLRVQYADYALWQRQWLGGAVQQEQLAYWRTHLAKAAELVNLPTDRPRPAVQDYAGASIEVQLDERLSAALKELSRKHGTTLYMTLLAAWSALVGRLAGQADVVIGSPVANRTRVEIEPLIGFFVNTLALRIDLSGQPTVGELLDRVRRSVLQGQAHQDVPFEQVVEALNPVRTLAHSPLFQLMFSWQNTPAQSLSLGSLRLQDLSEDEHHSAQFDLSLALQESGERIVGSLEYATALYERSTVERYLGYLKALLQGMVRDVAQGVERIAILEETERRLVLLGWNVILRAYPQQSCIQELFEQQVMRAPQGIAVEQGGQSLSYQELNERASRLAHWLRGQGVSPDERVGICVPRGIGMVVGILAVLKAAGAYVPLDASYPVERLAHMLDDSAPKVLLTHGSVRARLAAASPAVVLEIDDLGGWEGHSAYSSDNLEPAALGLRPDHLAYVIYTSGSTGQPKGVMVEHRAMVNFLASMQQQPGLESHDRLLAVTTLAFDIAGLELWLALICGARIVLARREEAVDGLLLRNLLERHAVCFFLVLLV